MTEPGIEPRGSVPYKGRLIAIDPGITTGVAIRVEGRLHTCVVDAYKLEDLFDIIDVIAPQQIVIERFIIGGSNVSMNPERLKTIELVGEVKGYCRAKQIECETATPGQRHSHQHESERNIGGLIPKGKVAVHEADALAHLFAWEYRHRDDH